MFNFAAYSPQPDDNKPEAVAQQFGELKYRVAVKSTFKIKAGKAS